MRITDVSKLKGPLGELHDQLFGDNGEERLAELNLWLKGVVSNLLKFVSEASISAVENFRVSDVLGAEGVNKDGVKIAFLSDNFKKITNGLVEQKVQAAKLAVYCLERYATALDIVSAIPSEKRVHHLLAGLSARQGASQRRSGAAARQRLGQHLPVLRERW